MFLLPVGTDAGHALAKVAQCIQGNMNRHQLSLRGTIQLVYFSRKNSNVPFVPFEQSLREVLKQRLTFCLGQTVLKASKSPMGKTSLSNKPNVFRTLIRPAVDGLYDVVVAMASSKVVLVAMALVHAVSAAM